MNMTLDLPDWDALGTSMLTLGTGEKRHWDEPISHDSPWRGPSAWMMVEQGRVRLNAFAAAEGKELTTGDAVFVQRPQGFNVQALEESRLRLTPPPN